LKRVNIEIMKELLKKGIEEGVFKDKLYKYREFGKYTNKIIEDSEFYFSSPLYFNDPFDCNLCFKDRYTKEEIIAKYEKYSLNMGISKDLLIAKYGLESEHFLKFATKFTQEVVSQSGILSLSELNDNITMWSHYAKNHEGLAFELDVKEDYDFFKSYGKVEYRDNYNLLSYTDISNDSLATLFLTKFTDWKYEDEVRIINYKTTGAMKFKKSALRTIYFGYKASLENIESMIQLCQINGYEHVEFKKAKLIPGKFALDFYDINKEEYL